MKTKMPKKPKCKQCGTCCDYIIFEVGCGNADEEDIEAQIKYYEAHGFKATRVGDRIDIKVTANCKHLLHSSKKTFCEIYDNRPPICKAYFCKECANV